MLNIGCHLSISKGLYNAALEAVSINANTFQFFTRNPRGGRAKDIDMDDINKLKDLIKEYNFAPLFAHGAYTMNLASASEDTRNFAKDILKDDLQRLKIIEHAYYVFHPGSHVKQGVEKGIELIVDALNEAIDEDNETIILLEGMSGKGTEIGRNMMELKQIINGVKNNRNIGIIIDTCHLYSSGHDIVNDLDGVLEHIDEVIGLDRLKAVHLNDSKMPFNSFKDRHALLGEGTIGLDAITKIINHPCLRHLTFNLETPNNVPGHGEEIKLLRGKYK